MYLYSHCIWSLRWCLDPSGVIASSDSARPSQCSQKVKRNYLFCSPRSLENPPEQVYYEKQEQREKFMRKDKILPICTEITTRTWIVWQHAAVIGFCADSFEQNQCLPMVVLSCGESRILYDTVYVLHISVPHSLNTAFSNQGFSH